MPRRLQFDRMGNGAGVILEDENGDPAVTTASTGTQLKVVDKGGGYLDARLKGFSTANTAAGNGTALRDTISDAVASGLKRIRVPEGSYDHDGLGVLPVCEVEGAGKGATILNYVGTGNGGTVSGEGDGRTILRGFSLVDKNRTAARGLQVSRRLEMEDVTIDHFQQHGLYFLTGADPGVEAPYFSHIRRVTLQNNGVGAELTSTCNGVVFQQCDVKNNTNEGYLIGQSENVEIHGGQAAYNGREGLKTVGTAYLMVLGLYGEGNNSGGLGAGAAYFDVNTSGGIVIFGNFQGTIVDASGGGVAFYRGGQLLSQLLTNLRRVNFGDDGSGSVTMGPTVAGDYQAAFDITCLGDVQDLNFNLGGQLGFGVKPNGVKLRMQLASAVSGINRVTLVYDETGAAVGYVPVYTSFTP